MLGIKKSVDAGTVDDILYTSIHYYAALPESIIQAVATVQCNPVLVVL